MPRMWRSDPCFTQASNQQSYKSLKASERILGELQTSLPRVQLRVSLAEALATMLAQFFLQHACTRQHAIVCSVVRPYSAGAM